jgi:hypothetical protein
MQTRVLILGTLLAWLFGGCSQAWGPVPSASPQSTRTSVSVASASPTEQWQVKCLDVQSGLPTGTELRGSPVLFNEDLSGSAYVIHSDGTKAPLPKNANEKLTFFAVSPSHQWLAYYAENTADETHSRLIVTDASGRAASAKVISKRDWWALDSWAGNDQLLLDKYQSVPGISLATPLPVVAFNPFKGLQDELLGKYPDMVNLYPKIEWQEYGFSAAGYDPTLSLVVYARQDGKIVLWDVKAARAITQLQSAASFGDGPVWLPDGSRFAIDSIPGSPTSAAEDFWKEELFIVERVGTVSRATFLTEQFSRVNISGYQWSPDGSHIAMWIRLQPDTFPDLPKGLSYIERLALLDPKTGAITLFCIPGGSSVAPIVWSPDSTQLLIDRLKDGVYDTVLVDIQNGWAAVLGENAVPEGWLLSSH